MTDGYELDLDGDRLREECGVFGNLYGHDDAATLTALGLHALQHRGQEAAGIVSFDGQRFQTERRLGLVGDHFTNDKVINRLQGRVALGHVRYSTTGETIRATRSRSLPNSPRAVLRVARTTATSPMA